MIPTFDFRRALAIAAAIGLCGSAQAGKHDGHAPDGADWWQWSVSIPVPANPILDPDGADCMLGQNGDTWYLAGTSGTSAERRCSVPEGVTLFFPVANAVNFDTPGVCGQEGHLSVAQLRGFSASFIDGITTHAITLDGRPVPDSRLRSDVFPLSLPADNFFNFPGCVVPAAVYPRSVDDGWYGRIEHLRPGAHTLHITAANDAGFSVDVTYHLTVVRRDRHGW